MIITIIILVYLIVVIFDFIPIVKTGEKKVYLTYFAFLAISLTVLILYGMDIRVPGPTDFIMHSISTLFGI